MFLDTWTLRDMDPVHGDLGLSESSERSRAEAPSPETSYIRPTYFGLRFIGFSV